VLEVFYAVSWYNMYHYNFIIARGFASTAQLGWIRIFFQPTLATGMSRSRPLPCNRPTISDSMRSK